jgi:hypothetical protein
LGPQSANDPKRTRALRQFGLRDEITPAAFNPAAIMIKLTINTNPADKYGSCCAALSKLGHAFEILLAPQATVSPIAINVRPMPRLKAEGFELDADQQDRDCCRARHKTACKSEPNDLAGCNAAMDRWCLEGVAIARMLMTMTVLMIMVMMAVVMTVAAGKYPKHSQRQQHY